MCQQIYRRWMELPRESRLCVEQSLLRLEENPLLGLKLWGKRDFYLYHDPHGVEIVYKFAQGRGQVLALRLSSQYHSPSKSKICAIVLAAGMADYNNVTSQLSPIGESSLISRLAEVFLSSGIHDLIVVLGYQAEQIKRELSVRYVGKDINVVVNPHYERGLSSSLKCGLHMLPRDATAVALALGNRPFVSSGVVDALIAAYERDRSSVVVPVYHRTMGHPVIFNIALVPDLLRVRGNVGGRSVLRRHRGELTELEVDDVGILRKIGKCSN